MGYVHLFGTKAAHDAVYNGERYKEPWLGYITADTTVTYNKVIDYKNIVGSIAYFDGSKVKFTSKEEWNSSLGTPIGVVVIPASHMTDGKCRVMSLCNMSHLTPSTGTLGVGNDNYETYGFDLMWGVSETDIAGLTNYTTVKTTSGTNEYGYLPSDLFGGGYYSDATDTLKCVSPYNSDGSKNTAYTTAGQVFADMDGKANTDVLVGLSRNEYVADTDSIANIQENYPAALACILFHTDGTVPGDWYLPTAGELGYVWARAKTINESIAELGTSSAVQIGTSMNDVSSLGTWCWSSSEGTTDETWFLDYKGSLARDLKGSYETGIRVRAFAAF